MYSIVLFTMSACYLARLTVSPVAEVVLPVTKTPRGATLHAAVSIWLFPRPEDED